MVGQLVVAAAVALPAHTGRERAREGESESERERQRERERERRNQAEEAAREASKALGTNTYAKLAAMAAKYEERCSGFERRVKDKENITYDSAAGEYMEV